MSRRPAAGRRNSEITRRFARQSPVRRQPRHRGSARCSRSRYAPVATAPLEGFGSDGRSTSPWSVASNACRSCARRDQLPPSTISRFGRSERSPASATQAPTVSRVCSVISNFTGRCAFCCITIARAQTRPPWTTSRTRSVTKSQSRNLLSIPRLSRARSRVRCSSCSRKRTAQISFGFSGNFCPTSLPLFHGHLTFSVAASICLASRLEKETDVHPSVGQIAHQEIRQVWRSWKRSIHVGNRPEADALRKWRAGLAHRLDQLMFDRTWHRGLPIPNPRQPAAGSHRPSKCSSGT